MDQNVKFVPPWTLSSLVDLLQTLHCIQKHLRMLQQIVLLALEIRVDPKNSFFCPIILPALGAADNGCCPIGVDCVVLR